MAKWYMVENNVHQKEALFAARVPVTELTIAKPRAITGLAFPEEERERVLGIIGLAGTRLTETKTDQGGVFFLEVWQPRVILESTSNMENWTEIEPVLREYAELLGVEIYAKNPHGEPSAPKNEEGKIFVRFWSTLENTADAKYEKVFGIGVGDGQRDGRQSSGQGIQIKTPEGQIVAEFVGGTLYVLFDLPHGNNAAALMKAIMERYLLLQKSPEELEKWRAEEVERERKRTEKERAESRIAYVRECGRRLGRVREETVKGIRDAENGLEAASRQIVELTRRLDGLRLKAAQLEESNKMMDTKFAEEYDKLLQMSHVKEVRVRDGVVSVFTDTIYLDCDNKVWELGDYQIDIFTNGKLKIQNLRVQELTGQTKFHHPHVFNNGEGNDTCLGNIREGVYRLIGQYEYSVAAQILIEFLQTMKKEGSYIGYLTNNWKSKPKEVKK